MYIEKMKTLTEAKRNSIAIPRRFPFPWIINRFQNHQIKTEKMSKFRIMFIEIKALRSLKMEIPGLFAIQVSYKTTG
jgi:hypothetical protein